MALSADGYCVDYDWTRADGDLKATHNLYHLLRKLHSGETLLTWLPELLLLDGLRSLSFFSFDVAFLFSWFSTSSATSKRFSSLDLFLSSSILHIYKKPVALYFVFNRYTYVIVN